MSTSARILPRAPHPIPPDAQEPVWSNVTAIELYDHRNERIYPTNFDLGEQENVAENQSFAAVVANLSTLLREQYGGSRR